MYRGFVIGVTVVCALNAIVGICAAIQLEHWGWYFAATLNLLVAIIMGNIKIDDK